jgi:hypothetical protein
MTVRPLVIALAVTLSSAAATQAQTVGLLFGPQSAPASRLANEGLGYSVVYPPANVEPRSFRVLLVCFGASSPRATYCPTPSHYGSCAPPVGTLVCR